MTNTRFFKIKTTQFVSRVIRRAISLLPIIIVKYLFVNELSLTERTRLGEEQVPIQIRGINMVDIRGKTTRGVRSLKQPEIMKIMRRIVWLCQFLVRGRIELRIAPNLLTRISLEAIPIGPHGITNLVNSHTRSIREWLEYFMENYRPSDFLELDSFLDEVEEFYPLTLDTYLMLCRERGEHYGQ